MASSDMSQRHKQLQSERDNLNSAVEEQRNAELDFYEDGSELSNDKAARMQEHSGNQAIQDLIDRLQTVDDDISDLEMEEAELELQEEDQEMDVDDTFQRRTDSGGGSGSSGNPWAQEFFYGGDDDPIQIRRKRRRKKRATDFLTDSDPQEDDEARTDQVNKMHQLLPSPLQGVRRGDSRYKAVELALQDVGSLLGHSLDPQKLLNRTGVFDPIRLPVEVGRFLQDNASEELAQSLGQLTGGPSAPLVSPQGGFSTAVSRLASLAICAEVAQGDVDKTDPAVALSLHYDAWEQCINVADQLSQQNQLHAPRIVEYLLGELPPQTETKKLPPPNLLGGAALDKILPPAMSFLPPTLNKPKQIQVEDDELLVMLDDALAEYTKGLDPYDLPRSPLVDIDLIQPSLQSANQLLNALGRSQVEFAAAAIAIRKVNNTAAIKEPLEHCDGVLRRIARGVVGAGRQLEQLQGHPTYEVSEQLDHCKTTLQDCQNALQALKSWALATFAACVEPNHVN
jgi:hypothetical protein